VGERDNLGFGVKKENRKMEARFYEKLDDKKVRCRLCPHNCVISPGKYGICRVRHNNEGVLDIPFYGKISSLASDPIEKKPLYHFYPGSSIVSIGFVGCSFHCPFCQNYHISMTTDAPTEYIEPERLVDIAIHEKSLGIAYTYSEPLIHMEYVLDTARLARKRGLKNVLVSNGYVDPGPAGELLEVLDAANIDLKTFNPGFYRKELGGKLEEVKRFISDAAGRISLEVTTLVIPGKNDSDEEIDEIARFLAALDPDIAYHLSCYYPMYRYHIPPTPVSTVKRLAEVARKHLHYVYMGNVGAMETNTYCPNCGNLIIRRRGYFVEVVDFKDSRCPKCGTVIPVVM